MGIRFEDPARHRLDSSSSRPIDLTGIRRVTSRITPVSRIVGASWRSSSEPWRTATKRAMVSALPELSCGSVMKQPRVPSNRRRIPRSQDLLRLADRRVDLFADDG